jgi:hypothetical protein
MIWFPWLIVKAAALAALLAMYLSSKVALAAVIASVTVHTVTPDLITVYQCMPTHQLPVPAKELTINGKTLKMYNGSCYEV